MPTTLVFELDDDQAKALEQLREEAGAASMQELIMDHALALFTWAVRESRSGYEIASINTDARRYTLLTMAVLDTIRDKAAKSGG